MTGADSRQEEAGTVRFVQDGTVVELHDVDPSRTVLQYLREDRRCTGTKEGCAEGDCGACTVVVLELAPGGDGLRLRPVNACIRFLATLDGKELLTVESLKGADGSLHPVQQAMIECHGSQCGYCTPGFVMSLFALYKTRPGPTRVDIDDALAGNLCRCTGYRPIVEAARRMYELGRDEDDWMRRPSGRGDAEAPAARLATLASVARQGSLSIRAGSRRFHAPRTARELAALLADEPDAVLLAGGTDVALTVTKELRQPRTLVFTGNVDELSGIDRRRDAIEIGAAVTLADAVPAIVEEYPELRELFVRFASPPIRNAATLGGNVANGSPIGDSMPALLVLDSVLTLTSAAGQRELPLADFYLGYRRTALAPGEFLQSIRIPRRDAGDLVRSYKVSKRFDQDISAVCGAFRLRYADRRIREARVAFGGMAAVPARAPRCEAALAGRPLDDGTLAAAIVALGQDYTPIGDLRASREYRIRVAGNLLRRLRYELSGAVAPGGVYSHGRV